MPPTPSPPPRTLRSARGARTVALVPAADDRWDVVVVGLRDPSQASAVMVVAELAHYASLPPHDVERMLDEGEVLVLTNLDHAEAERAAYELSELGAMVDLRLTSGHGQVFPVFKPDAERLIGVAVGGIIDDSATPPTVGESLGLPELEPDLEGPGQMRTRPRVRTPRPGPQPPSAGPPDLTLPDDEPPPPPAPRPTAARARAERRSPAKSAGLDRLLGDLGPAAPASAPAPMLPPRLQRATAAAQGAERSLELDFEAAGMVRPPRDGGFGAATRPAEADGALPRHTRAGPMSGTGASAAGRSQEPGSLLAALRSDGVTALLLGLVVGLGLALVLALTIQRGHARERLPPLEEELAAALNDPAGVQTGKHREPAAIEDELDGVLEELQRTFLLWWLGPGLAAGLLLSRLRAR